MAYIISFIQNSGVQQTYNGIVAEDGEVINLIEFDKIKRDFYTLEAHSKIQEVGWNNHLFRDEDGEELTTNDAQRLFSEQLSLTGGRLPTFSDSLQLIKDVDYYYIVKNPSETDKANVKISLLDTTVVSDNYFIGRYEDSYAFDGTEEYVHELTKKEANVAKLSPVFVDYTSDTIDEKETKLREFKEFDNSTLNEVKNKVEAYYLVESLSDADQDTVLVAFNTALSYANAGAVERCRDIVQAITATALIPQSLIDNIVSQLNKHLEIFLRN